MAHLPTPGLKIVLANIHRYDEASASAAEFE